MAAVTGAPRFSAIVVARDEEAFMRNRGIDAATGRVRGEQPR